MANLDKYLFKGTAIRILFQDVIGVDGNKINIRKRVPQLTLEFTKLITKEITNSDVLKFDELYSLYENLREYGNAKRPTSEPYNLKDLPTLSYFNRLSNGISGPLFKNAYKPVKKDETFNTNNVLLIDENYKQLKNLNFGESDEFDEAFENAFGTASSESREAQNRDLNHMIFLTFWNYIKKLQMKKNLGDLNLQSII